MAIDFLDSSEHLECHALSYAPIDTAMLKAIAAILMDEDETTHYFVIGNEGECDYPCSLTEALSAFGDEGFFCIQGENKAVGIRVGFCAWAADRTIVISASFRVLKAIIENHDALTRLISQFRKVGGLIGSMKFLIDGEIYMAEQIADVFTNREDLLTDIATLEADTFAKLIWQIASAV